ncbi:hypothetical protein quinque_001313 [Culex quinquefasciatus]
MRRLPRDLLWTAVFVLCRFQVLFGLGGLSGILEPASGRWQEELQNLEINLHNNATASEALFIATTIVLAT